MNESPCSHGINKSIYVMLGGLNANKTNKTVKRKRMNKGVRSQIEIETECDQERLLHYGAYKQRGLKEPKE